MKKAITIRIKEETINRLRSIVYITHGLTLTDLCNLALEREVIKWEGMYKEHEKDGIKLKPGRKVFKAAQKDLSLDEQS